MKNRDGSATLIAIVILTILSAAIVFKYENYHTEMNLVHKITETYKYQ
ncbi:hypothetical protein [Apilactobacillus bombintestini]|nr:hypothetical protein [Apilactobacillus bombintestini]